MALETLDSQIDIRGLGLEIPGKAELPFDPERDITVQDWAWIQRDMEASRKNAADIFALEAAKLALAFPEKTHLISYGLDDDFAGMLKARYEEETNPSIRPDPDRARIAGIASGIKLLFPGIMDEITLPDWMAQELLRDARTTLRTDYRAMCFSVINLLTLYPEFSPGLPRDEKLFKDITAELKSIYVYKDTLEAVHLLAAAKIIYGSRVNDFNLSLASWQAVKAELARTRENKDVYEFLSLAGIMKIAAAGDVEVLHDGFRIIKGVPPAEMKDGSQPVPQERKF